MHNNVLLDHIITVLSCICITNVYVIIIVIIIIILITVMVDFDVFLALSSWASNFSWYDTLNLYQMQLQSVHLSVDEIVSIP